MSASLGRIRRTACLSPEDLGDQVPFDTCLRVQSALNQVTNWRVVWIFWSHLRKVCWMGMFLPHGQYTNVVVSQLWGGNSKRLWCANDNESKVPPLAQALDIPANDARKPWRNRCRSAICVSGNPVTNRGAGCMLNQRNLGLALGGAVR